MSWPSTPTTITPPLSFVAVKPISPPKIEKNRRSAPGPLEEGHRRDLYNISRGGPARQVGHREGQSLQQGPQGRRARQALHQLVADVPGVEVGEDEDIGLPSRGAPGR